MCFHIYSLPFLFYRYIMFFDNCKLFVFKWEPRKLQELVFKPTVVYYFSFTCPTLYFHFLWHIFLVLHLRVIITLKNETTIITRCCDYNLKNELTLIVRCFRGGKTLIMWLLMNVYFSPTISMVQMGDKISKTFTTVQMQSYHRIYSNIW